MDLLYLDDQILAVDKPAGFLSIQDGYNSALIHAKAVVEKEFGRVWTVHRLDKETSGVLLFARTSEAHRFLSIEFENRRVEKRYWAAVYGNLTAHDFCIDLPLLVNGDRKHRTIVDSKRGKPAKTEISLSESRGEFSVLSVLPKTGYTHQIRSHLCFIGHPVLGDPLYQKKDISISEEILQNITRMALHAKEISFLHPKNKIRQSIFADVPQDLLLLLK